MKQTVMLLLLIIGLQTAAASALTGTVLSIHDGDTLTILPEGSKKKSKVRLLGVDAPEIDFNGNSQGEMAELARDYLQSMLPIKSMVRIELPENGLDNNGRYLGQIIYNQRDLNLEMLKAGWGAVYFIFPFDKKIVASYIHISKVASEEGRGIFSAKYKGESLPYIFRQAAKGTPGTNIVADFVSKKIYSAESIESIPHYQRVFFTSEEIARSRGFSW